MAKSITNIIMSLLVFLVIAFVIFILLQKYEHQIPRHTTETINELVFTLLGTGAAATLLVRLLTKRDSTILIKLIVNYLAIDGTWRYGSMCVSLDYNEFLLAALALTGIAAYMIATALKLADIPNLTIFPFHMRTFNHLSAFLHIVTLLVIFLLIQVGFSKRFQLIIFHAYALLINYLVYQLPRSQYNTVIEHVIARISKARPLFFLLAICYYTMPTGVFILELTSAKIELFLLYHFGFFMSYNFTLVIIETI